MLIAIAFFLIYLSLYALSCSVEAIKDDDDYLWSIVMLGSVFGGIANGIGWPAQVSFLSNYLIFTVNL